jgi:signal transduction histidine kinase
MIGNPRLREVRELMLRGVRVFTLSIVLSTIFILLVAWVGGSDPELFLFNTFLGSFIILMVLDPIRNQIDAFIMKRLIVDSAEFEKAVQNLLRKIRRTRSSKDLFEVLVTGLEETSRVYKIGVYLWDPQALVFRASSESTLNNPTQLSPDSGIVRYFQRTKSNALRESAEDSKAIQLLRELRAHIVLPIFQAEDLVAVWAIRTSLAGESAYTSFTNSEIDLLVRAASEVSTILDQVKYFERMESQQRLAALGEMSAALAHEIRNPLGALQGASMLLETSPTLAAEEDRECVRILKTELERLQQTVDQYLHFARRTETLVESEIQLIIQKAIKASEAKALKTRTQIQFEKQSHPLLLWTDPLKLEQVLINLIQNACEAFSKNVKIQIQSSDEEYEIQVLDDGPGIASDVLPSIFTPLFTTKKAGSGLGLPICKKIVDSLGGILGVQSQVGVGSTFSIRLNRQQSNRQQTEKVLA